MKNQIEIKSKTLQIRLTEKEFEEIEELANHLMEKEYKIIKPSTIARELLLREVKNIRIKEDLGVLNG